MEVASEIMKGVAQVLMVPAKRQLDYVISHRKHVVDMRTKRDELNAKRDREEEHLTQNRERHLEVPAQVSEWLSKVEDLNKEADDFPQEVLGCFDLKSRHKLGRRASKIIKEIDNLTTQHSEICWTDQKIPLGRIDSTIASTSTPSSDHNDFPSRVKTYNKALEALGPDHKTHMVALWGMGGVGKTTMMEKLRQAVVEKKMFSYLALAVIGQNPDVKAVQSSIASYLDIMLNDQAPKQVRVDELRKGFQAKLNGGKKTFLVILDDVWQPFDLKDIGLSPSDNQGVNFKVLLTSRNRDVCTQMGVKADSVLSVGLLTEAEAKSLFCQHWEPSHDVDPELHKIREDIVGKCLGLPIAIKTMACTLRDKCKDTWKDALSRLEHHGINTVGTVADTVFKTSYDNLKEKVAEATFLLCGLFPEDFDIPTEELLMYGWGLKLFEGVRSIREARYRLNTFIEQLVHTNLLIQSENVGCVKMHDLVRNFVLDMFSKVDHASIVNHGRNQGWPEDDVIASSCKNVSLTCKGMSEFPSHLKFPNLSILKLMNGDESLRFHQSFYLEIEKLQVISFDDMVFPLFPSSLECSTNLRVLRVHECRLNFDLSYIGNLLNLEVLSFADSNIKSLPCTIGKLKKLRVLDLTRCVGIHIDNGDFKNLVRLEELYAKVDDYYKESIYFTGDYCNEVAERWKNLSSLAIHFYKDNVQWKNLSFDKLERFKISVGSCFRGTEFTKNDHSFENMLKLETKKGEVSGSRINKLFEKTVMLWLIVDDMNDLEDVGAKSSLGLPSSSFGNLKNLVVSECLELKYLFTLGVAKVLSNLEHLEVFDCPVMKELIHMETGAEDRVTFPKLRSLSLRRLPNLLGMCYSMDNLTTSCFLKEEVVIPKLETLQIEDLDDLEQLWPCDFRTSDQESNMREIEVSGCKKLVNLFPCNPMPLLHHLEELQVERCGSIEVLFNIDLDCVGVTGEEECSSSNLRNIKVHESGKLREVWRIKGGENNSRLPIRGFQAVESICIRGCQSFRDVVSPTTTNFDLGALIDMRISESGDIGKKYGLVESSQDEEISVLLKEETSQVSDSISYTGMCGIHPLHNPRKLRLDYHKGVEVIFEIESTQRSQDYQPPLFPCLEELDISYMDTMTHVWRCNWNEFLIHHKQLSKSPFHNLTTICMSECHNIKYLFSPLMAKLLSNLKKIEISYCRGIEEVVSHKDDEDEDKATSISFNVITTLFPHLDSLILFHLPILKCIGGGGGAKDGINEISTRTTTTNAFHDQYKFSQGDGVSWTLCQYPREISLSDCDVLSSVVPCYATGQMQKLQVLKIKWCHGMKEVFETQGINNKSINIMLNLTNLKELHIVSCHLLEHIFTFSTLETLGQLEELKIDTCMSMKVIVKEEQTTTSSSKAVVLPRLKCIELDHLPELVGFFLGTNIDFHWPSLDKVTIARCQQMKAFTAGGSTAPQLEYVQTTLGKSSPPGCWFNSHVTTNNKEGTGSSCPAATSEVINYWYFSNLIELRMSLYSYFRGKVIVPYNELLHLQKLEKIHLSRCDLLEEVFEALEGINTTTAFDESQTTLVSLPNLTKVHFCALDYLKYMWKRNQWTLFEFPNLTKVSIRGCQSLEHVFTSSMVGSLKQLQELKISYCQKMEEVIIEDANVVEEDGEIFDGKMNEIVLPRLSSLKLESLKCLKGFCLGKEDFSFPSLETVTILECPAITTFTEGNSSTPKLKEITTRNGLFMWRKTSTPL